VKDGLLTLVVDCGDDFQDGARGVGAEVEHKGIVEVVIGNESVGYDVENVSRETSVLEGRGSNLHKNVVKRNV
jgi:hypothetical protein